jgi:hypothetical protein
VGIPAPRDEDEDDDDESWRPSPDDNDDDDSDGSESGDQSVPKNDDELGHADHAEDGTSEPEDSNNHVTDGAITQGLDNFHGSTDIDVEVRLVTHVDEDAASQENDPANDPTDDTADDMDQRYGQRDHSYGLRTRRPRDFGHLHIILEETVMTQFSMNRGIKEFGDAGIEAVLKELQQLHNRGVVAAN